MIGIKIESSVSNAADKPPGWEMRTENALNIQRNLPKDWALIKE